MGRREGRGLEGPEWAGPGARPVCLAWYPSAEHGLGTYITDAALGCVAWALRGRGRSERSERLRVLLVYLLPIFEDCAVPEASANSLVSCKRCP